MDTTQRTRFDNSNRGGAIQKHSQGPLFPWTIVIEGGPGYLSRYHGLNPDGRRTPRYDTNEEAIRAVWYQITYDRVESSLDVAEPDGWTLPIDPYRLGGLPTSGYFVSRDGGYKRPVEYVGPAEISNNVTALLDSGAEFLGLWVHDSTLFLDATEWTDDRAAALDLMRHHNQLCGWDVAGACELWPE